MKTACSHFCSSSSRLAQCSKDAIHFSHHGPSIQVIEELNASKPDNVKAKGLLKLLAEYKISYPLQVVLPHLKRELLKPNSKDLSFLLQSISL